MARPLFEIAQEISADWPGVTPQAKTYLKGMYYLLGMDDYAADLDASTTVRMFLMYAKEWTGPVAERVKAELQSMRSTNAPKNTDLLHDRSFTPSNQTLAHCEVCEVELKAPAKFVDAYTHWGPRLRMCMHCNYCNSMGLIEGDGALYIAADSGAFVKLYGEPKAPAPHPIQERPSKTAALYEKPPLRFRLKLFGRKVIRKCGKIVRAWTKRPA